MYQNGELVCSHKWLFAPYGDDSANAWSAPGSAAPHPALSMIGQLRSPF